MAIKKSFNGEYKMSEYYAWQGMKNRCYYKNNDSYTLYGGNGIIVCEQRRNDFIQFIKDMGRRPSKTHQIDRIDSKENYSPDNCRWVTPRENSLNRKTTKLNIEIVKEMRLIYPSINNYAELGRIYNVCKKTARMVILNKTWMED